MFWFWSQALIISPDIPNPVDWGWVEKTRQLCLNPSRAVSVQLIKCGCKQHVQVDVNVSEVI